VPAFAKFDLIKQPRQADQPDGPGYQNSQRSVRQSGAFASSPNCFTAHPSNVGGLIGEQYFAGEILVDPIAALWTLPPHCFYLIEKSR
jgi:hypothetical protein